MEVETRTKNNVFETKELHRTRRWLCGASQDRTSALVAMSDDFGKFGAQFANIKFDLTSTRRSAHRQQCTTAIRCIVWTRFPHLQYCRHPFWIMDYRGWHDPFSIAALLSLRPYARFR